MKTTKRLSIGNLSFSLKFDKLKDKFILKSPTANNVEFKSIDDVMAFVRTNYPRFVINKFKELKARFVNNG